MLYQGNLFGTTGGGGYVWVGFQDAVTISGPPPAAYQTIPITLRAHLDGTLVPGNGVYTPNDNYGYVRFNTQLAGKDGTTGFGYYKGAEPQFRA